MTRTSVVISSLSATLLGTAALAQAPPSEIDAHIATAKSRRRQEHRDTFINLCLPSAPRGGGAGRAGGGARGAAPRRRAEPVRRRRRTARTGMRRPSRCSTTLYWLGTRQHSSWALQTSAGIIIIDTNFAWATRPEIIDGMTKLGLNPSDIKYVIISHAHGDHDQGAAELQERYSAQVVMGAADWDATLKRPPTAAGGVPRKDISIGAEGRKLTLGDTTIEIVATPGHSPGTLSYVFPVKDQGKTIMVAYSGGTLTGGFGTDGARWDEYIASQRKIAKAAADAGASVLLSNHSEYDGAYTKARLLAAPRQPGENHPFIIGADAVQRYFTVMAECAMASKLRRARNSGETAGRVFEGLVSRERSRPCETPVGAHPLCAAR